MAKKRGIGLGAILLGLLILLAMNRKEPGGTLPPTYTRVSLVHVGGGIDNLRISILGAKGVRTAYRGSISPDFPTGRSVPLDTTQLESVGIIIDYTNAAQSGNKLIFEFLDRASIEVVLGRGGSKEIDTRKA